MDEFQLGAKAELFPNYFATEEGTFESNIPRETRAQNLGKM